MHLLFNGHISSLVSMGAGLLNALLCMGKRCMFNEIA